VKKVVRYIALSLFVTVLISGGSAAPATLVVKADGTGDVPTIQAAIDIASTGDGIVVWGGHYYEDDLLVDGKDLYFQYQQGTPVIISSSYRQGTGIIFRNVGAGTSLLGFEFRKFARGISIENGAGTYWFCDLIDCGAAIEVSGALSAPDIMFSLVDSCGTGIDLLDGSGIEIRNLTIVNAGTGIEALGGTAVVTRCIIYGCVTGTLCSGGSISLSCNNFHLNMADYSGCAASLDDFYGLTRFCYAAGESPGLYYLHVDSPCWAENNACGVDVGAFIQLPGCTGTAVEETSWGAIKKMHR
jgi:hypothetical protein